MANAENGSEPILCICISVIINTMLKLMFTSTQKLRVNKTLGIKNYRKEVGALIFYQSLK